MRALTAALVLTAAVACTGDEPGDEPGQPSPIHGTIVFTTNRDVRLALPDGGMRVIAERQAEADGCAWSGDGRYAAWTGSGVGGTTLYVHEVATGRTGTWVDERAGGEPLAGTATGFAIVHRATGQPPELVLADAATIVAGGQPRVVRLPLRAGELVTAAGTRVLVEQPKIGAAFTGGPSTVYDVTAEGRVRPLFTNRRTLPVGDADLTADGERLVYAAGDRTPDPDRTNEYLVVRDLATGRELEVPTPARPEGETVGVLSVETGADGQTVAAVSFHTADGEELPNVAYVLDGDRWRQVAEHAEWAATGPTGLLAVIDDDDAQQLHVGGLYFGRGVECAAWAPA
jgi:hypothetical protein